MNGKFLFTLLLFSFHTYLPAQTLRIVCNQVGYESGGPKHAVLMVDKPDSNLVARLRNARVELIDEQNKIVYTTNPIPSGRVDDWKNWIFYLVDFTGFKGKGEFRLRIAGSPETTAAFTIDKEVLEGNTLSGLLYYFKGQRSSGLLDVADRTLPFEGGKDNRRVDVHGGWYDATGDYGIHLSHLSFSTYFNPQQVSLTAWGLLKTYLLMSQKAGNGYRQYKRRALDEAMFGADFLYRMKVSGGSFYRSVSAPGPGKKAADRVVGAENKGYSIKQSASQSFTKGSNESDERSFQTSFRSGGGVAIAALALASTLDSTGDYSKAGYLAAAESAFAFLQKHNAEMTNDGKENMLDDYCALMAATELYRATRKPDYQSAAAARAKALTTRLQSWKNYKDYWRVNETDRPFFHAADAGLPVVSLLNFYPLASPAQQEEIKDAVARSLRHELGITHEVSNPFGYSRQLVQDTSGARRSSFFYPHGAETAPWWQGENARLGSMAAAARMAMPLFASEAAFSDSLETFASDQLNWILGCNPFDACMLEGRGHNNVEYGFFGTFEYSNAPGGIVNGVTSGLENEHGIDLNITYAQTGKDYDWRWGEQWLPHATWFMLAVASHQ